MYSWQSPATGAAHNVLKISAIFSYSALPEHQSQNAAPRRYFARRQ